MDSEKAKFLVGLAMDGDQDATDQLRESLTDQHDCWRNISDTGMLGLARIIQATAGSTEFAQELFRRHVDALWRELAGDQPTGLLRICVQAVIAASLEVDHLNMLFPAADENWSIQQHTLLLRRRDSAQRRLASAVKTYLLVRKHQPASDESLQANSNGHHAHGNGHTANGKGYHANGNGAIPAYLQNRFANLLIAEDDA